MSQRFLPMRVPVSLRALFPGASFVGCADVRVTDATDCSQKCSPQTLFAAIPGCRQDGTIFVAEAVKQGATSLLVQRPLPSVNVPQCIVPNVRKAYAELCAALAGSPSRFLNLAAVTGTNGKTTVTWLVRSILETSGHRTGLIGTIEYHNGVDSAPAGMTTPEPKTLSHWLKKMVSGGATHAAMEVSSHALDQERTAGTQFDVAVVTNITQDHFDYHHTAASYRDAKRRIFEHLKPEGLVVLNADDAESSSLAEHVPAGVEIWTYGLERSARVWGTILDESVHGTRFTLRSGDDSVEVTTPLIGRHNVSNCLAAAAIAQRFGISLTAIKTGIERLRMIPGRFERVDYGQSFDVFVDYAHTEDALRRCIISLKRLARGRVICVAGAGGDRDRSKRPRMGAALSVADLAVVTSDNPRSEDPEQIIHDVLSGCDPTGHEPLVEIDRAEAIRRAVEIAEPGDCLLVAGKGHEREQIIGSRRIPFIDREVVRDALAHRRQGLKAAPVRVHG